MFAVAGFERKRKKSTRPGTTLAATAGRMDVCRDLLARANVELERFSQTLECDGCTSKARGENQI